MKRFGFTLAEVLITLGIIGVVAALTAPALVQNAGTAKIGPTLSKVVSTLENANEQMMHDEDVTSLYSLASSDSSLYEDDTSAYEESMRNAMLKYCTLLSKYISGSSYETEPVKNSDFVTVPRHYDGSFNYGVDGYILFHFSDNVDLLLAEFSPQTKVSRGSFKGEFDMCIVDINGIKAKPNTFGKDMFIFSIDNSGSLLAHGSKTYDFAYNNSNGTTWEGENSSFACNEDKVASEGFGCAGSIFDNNFKVIYQ